MVRTQDGRSHPGPENRMCKTRSQSHLVNRFLMRKYDRSEYASDTRDVRRSSRLDAACPCGLWSSPPPPHAPRESQSESPTGA